MTVDNEMKHVLKYSLACQQVPIILGLFVCSYHVKIYTEDKIPKKKTK